MSQLRQEQNVTALKPGVSYQKKRILVVDDEVDITTILKLGLEKADFQVDVYNEPSLALFDYQSGMYALLLLDINMPKMNGFELYQKIKDRENIGNGERNDDDDDVDCKPKVCFITAYEEYWVQFKESFPILEEVDYFLRKLITMADLLKAVKSQLRLV